jgi:hypothetical protein
MKDLTSVLLPRIAQLPPSGESRWIVRSRGTFLDVALDWIKTAQVSRVLWPQLTTRSSAAPEPRHQCHHRGAVPR